MANGNDLPYHISRLVQNDADIDARIQAAECIYRYIVGSVEALSDDLLGKFVNVFNSTDNVGLQSELAHILGYRWGTMAEVQKLMERSMQERSGPVLQKFLTSLVSRLQNSTELSQDPGIRSIVANVHGILDKKEPGVQTWACHLLHQWGVSSYADVSGNGKIDLPFDLMTSEKIRDEQSDVFLTISESMLSLLDAQQYEQWTVKLRELYGTCGDADAMLQSKIVDLLSLLERRSRGSVLADLPEKKDDNSVEIDLLDMMLTKMPPTLSADEEAQLAAHIQAHPETPNTALTGLLQNRPYLFLNITSQEGWNKMPGVVRILEEEAHLSHVAINIAPECEEAFRRFLAGDDPPEIRRSYGISYQIFADECREVLQKIDAIDGVAWAFIGASAGISAHGELALDAQTKHLLSVRKSDAAGSRSKILVLGYGHSEFDYLSRSDLVDSDTGAKTRTLPKNIIGDAGEDQVACVFEAGIDDRFDTAQTDDEIEEFCRSHNIIHSFAVPMGKTPLDEKPFLAEMCENTYGDSLDTFIVFVPRDTDDEGHREEKPDPSIDNVLDPVGSLV